MKKFIVRVNYTDYALDPQDAVALLAIVSRMQVVKQNDYNGPYFVQPDQDTWLDSLSLSEVAAPAEPEIDISSADARDILKDG